MMERAELRRRLFEKVCYFAEHAFCHVTHGIGRDDVLFHPFKPGGGDKLLLKEIVDQNLEWAEIEVSITHPDLIDSAFDQMAFELLNYDYRFRYGEFDKLQRKQHT